MRIAIIGLGRMGANIARRLLRGGHGVVAFDRNAEAVAALAREGALGVSSLDEAAANMPARRVFWVMLPAGDATEDTIAALMQRAAPGDILIDAGNSFYKDDIRRATACAAAQLDYVDVGTSGGICGLDRGYCLMIGGAQEAVEYLDPIFATLAPGMGSIDRTVGRRSQDDRAERGYLHVGPPGSGHFVKMVHNGIEYGLMQAFAEGFDVLKGRASSQLPATERFTIDVAEVAELWRRGSVVSSWLLDLAATALARDGELENYTGRVADSGEGRWTIDAAMEEAVPVTVLSAALFERYRSRSDERFGDKLLSAMRRGFGGHREAPGMPQRPERAGSQ